MEYVDIDLTPRCDDGTLPSTSLIHKFYEYLDDATMRASKPIRYNSDIGRMLAAQGFVDIREQVFKLPLSTWPKDPHLKNVGRWYNFGLSEGLEAFCMGPFTRMYDWKADDVRRFVADLKKEMSIRQYHVYNNM